MAAQKVGIRLFVFCAGDGYITNKNHIPVSFSAESSYCGVGEEPAMFPSDVQGISEL